MTDDQRAGVFTPGQWRRLTAATDLTVAPPLQRLRMALDTMARTAPLRARPLPRPEVLVVCGDHAGEPSGELERGLLDRLPAMRLICHLAAPDAPSRAPSAPGIPTVVVAGTDPASAILTAMAAQGL
ncbi:hypothetical protein OG607_31185 [Streptomyces sp. NBC_01537]|uniref:hypothetical protein n=1 Tax=Streptomyces sp. NBC_01537 TaxID=2903896 RepID=UPI003863D69B